jgi:lysophospholipase L1-like esterase
MHPPIRFIPLILATLFSGSPLWPIRAQVSTVPGVVSNASTAFDTASTAKLTSSSADSVAATVTILDGSLGKEIASSFAGLSYELSTLLPNPEGIRYFRPDNKPLLNVFRTLGIGSLRVGGNLGDRDFKIAPSEADIDSLFAFAKEAGVKVIYCLRLHHGDAAEQARIAKYIWDRYEPLLDCFTIGQEPSAYPVETVDMRRADQRMGEAHEHFRYEDFAASWRRFDDEIRKSIPNVRIGGPSVYRKTDWPLHFLSDFAKDGRLSLLTAHLYPGGPGNEMVATPEIGRERMLSGEFEPGYRNISENVLCSAAANHLGFRIEECNNYFNGGCKGVSDTFASSLWGLDFLWWWASQGAEGINFHTGEKVAAGSTLATCAYTSFFMTPEGVQVQPLGYAIKAFGLAGKGDIVPVNISPSESSLRLSAYAALASNTLTVTLINRSGEKAPRAINVTLAVSNAPASAESITLTAPGGDLSVTKNITIGGSGISNEGIWNGVWNSIPRSDTGGLLVSVPPGSAVLVRFPVSGEGWKVPAVLKPSSRTAEDAVTPVANVRHEQFLEEIRNRQGNVGLVLVGDSITDLWPKTGLDSYLGLLTWKPLNLGVGGERTEQVLWRLQHGELEGYKGKAFMIMIGTNNLRFTDEKPEWVAAGIRKIVEAIRRKQPQAKILLLGVFPRGINKDDPMRSRIAEINKLIAPLDDGKKVFYMDLGKEFLDSKGNLSREIMPDFLHPSAQGYRIWLEAVKQPLTKLMK